MGVSEATIHAEGSFRKYLLDNLKTEYKKIGGEGQTRVFFEKPSKKLVKNIQNQVYRKLAPDTARAEVRKIFDNFIAEGKSTYTTADIMEKLPKDTTFYEYKEAISSTKKDKKYKKLKFKKQRNVFIKPAEDIKWVMNLIDEGKVLKEITAETGFDYGFIKKVEAHHELKIAETTFDKYKNFKKIIADIETLANDNRIKNAFKAGKIDEELLKLVGTVLKSDDVYRNSRTLFKLAEYYDGSLEAYYKVNLPKPDQKQIEGSKKIINSSRRFTNRRTGYAFDNLLYEYGGKKVDRILGLADGTFLKIQKEIAEKLPSKIGVDEVFGIKSSGRHAPVQAVLINPLKGTLNVEKSAVDAFKSQYQDQLIEASKIKNKAERITEQKRILKEYRTTLSGWKNDPRYKNVEFPDFEIGKHPSKTIKNWAELGPVIKKQLIADYKATDISPKVTKARNIFQIAEEVGSKTWKNLSPKIQNLLRIAKTTKGPPRLKALQMLVSLGVGTAVFTSLGINTSKAENEKLQTLEPGDKTQEASVFPYDIVSAIAEDPKKAATLGTAAAIGTAPRKAWEAVKWAGRKLLPIMAPGVSHAFKLWEGKPYNPTSGHDMTTMAFWKSVIDTMGKTSKLGDATVPLKKRLKDLAWRGLLPTRFLPLISGGASLAAGPMLINDAAKWLQDRLEKKDLTGKGGIADYAGIISDEAGGSLFIEDVVKEKQKQAAEGMDYAQGGIASLMK